MKELIVSRGGRRLQRLSLENDSIVIGRNPDCDVVLEGHVVSRKHAMLERRGDVYALVDAGSLNGVTMDGAKLESPRLLVSGDRFQVADVDFVYLDSEGDDLTRPLDVSGPRIGVDAAAHEAWLEPGRRALDLTPQEFTLLSLLQARQGQVVTHATIGDAVWGSSNVDGRALPQYDVTLVQRLVSRLRDELRKAGAPDDMLTNVRGVGYKLL